MQTSILGRLCQKKSATSRTYRVVAMWNMINDSSPMALIEDVISGELSTIWAIKIKLLPEKTVDEAKTELSTLLDQLVDVFKPK